MAHKRKRLTVADMQRKLKDLQAQHKQTIGVTDSQRQVITELETLVDVLKQREEDLGQRVGELTTENTKRANESFVLHTAISAANGLIKRSETDMAKVMVDYYRVASRYVDDLRAKDMLDEASKKTEGSGSGTGKWTVSAAKVEIPPNAEF